MKILVLQGPNLNLLGLVSKQSGGQLTLDKLNRALRQRAGELDMELTIHQLHSEAKATRLIQRQRNKVNGVLLVPGIWAATGVLLKETIRIVALPLAVFHLAPAQGPWHHHDKSIFADCALMEESGDSAEGLCELMSSFAASLK